MSRVHQTLRSVRFARATYLLILGAALIAGVALAVEWGPRYGAPTVKPSAAAPANPDVDSGSPAGNVPAPDFTLRDQDDRPTSLAEFRGKVVMLAFVDSQCTSICPLTTESMVQALHLLGPGAAHVQLLGIDANPLATQVADVAAYTREHHLQGQWRFLTGPLPELEQVWRSYHVYVAASQGDIDHEPLVVLIGPKGRERTVFLTQLSYEGVSQQARLFAEQISRLLPARPPVHDATSLAYVPPLKPGSVVRLPALGSAGETVVLGDGRPRLLLFFAGWLAPSSTLRTRLASLDEYASTARQRHWALPLAVDEIPAEVSATDAERLLGSLAATLRTPIVRDERGRLGDGYGVQDLPWFALTSASGQIIWHHDGWLSAVSLEQQVRAALARAGGAPRASRALDARRS